MAPTNFYILVNGVVNVIATGSFGDCNGLQTYQNVTNGSTWTSGNPAIATVNNTTHKGRVTGVRPGSTFASADHTEPRWLFSPNIGCFQQGLFDHMAQSSTNVCGLSISSPPGGADVPTEFVGMSATGEPWRQGAHIATARRVRHPARRESWPTQRRLRIARGRFRAHVGRRNRRRPQRYRLPWRLDDLERSSSHPKRAHW